MQYFAKIFILLLLTIKVNAQGPNWLWAKNATGPSNTLPGANITSIAVDSLGNTYILGLFSATPITFDNITVTATSSNSTVGGLFLVKYSPNGNVLWAKAATPYGTSITVDASGNVYLLGKFIETFTIGTLTLTTTQYTQKIFIAKFDTNGNNIWLKKTEGTTTGLEPTQIKVDVNGFIYFTGGFGPGSLSFSPSINIYNQAIPYYSVEGFIAKYDSNGNAVWAKSFGNVDPFYNYGKALALDTIGNIYLAGVFRDSTFMIDGITLYNDSLSTGNYYDIFISKFNTNGNIIWANSCGGSNEDEVNSIAIDAFGNSYIAGCYKGSSIHFDSLNLINTNNWYKDLYLTKYDALGNPIWTQSTNGAFNDEAKSVAVDKLNYVYLSGFVEGATVNFDTVSLTNSSLSNVQITNMFLTKFNSNGDAIWLKGSNVLAGTVINSNAVDLQGNSYVGGFSGLPVLNLDSLTVVGSATSFRIFTGKLANISVNTNHTNVNCFGGNNGSATAFLTAGSVAASYLWNTVPPQTTQTATGLAAGTYTITVIDTNGFQTMNYVTITQPNQIVKNLTQVICLGDSIVFNNQTHFNSGIYSDTLTAISGCDSIVRLNLIVYIPDTVQKFQTICQGNNYNFYGTLISSAGTYFHTLTTPHGCDSVIQLTTIISPIFNTNNSQTICANETYNINGHSYNLSGTYIDTLSSVAGCDSIVNTNLNVRPIYVIQNFQEICSGNSYTFNGHSYNISGVYRDTLQSTLSCDSIIVTQLTVQPNYLLSNNMKICSGDSIFFKNEFLSSPGIFYDTLTTTFGCDSIIMLDLSIANIDTTSIIASICKGNSYSFLGNNIEVEGTYFKTIASSFGCDSVLKLNITVNSLPIVKTISDTTINEGSIIELFTSQNSYEYLWSPNLYLSSNNIASPLANPIDDITYIVTGTDLNGCKMSDTLNINVEKSNLWVPNVFEPNNFEPINQKFYVRGKSILEFEIKIFSRWGVIVYQSNDINDGWDGTYKGEQISTGIFTYLINAKFQNGKSQTYSGNFTLLR